MISRATYEADPATAWAGLKTRADSVKEPLVRAFAIWNLYQLRREATPAAIAGTRESATRAAAGRCLAFNWPSNPTLESFTVFEAFWSSIGDAERALKKHGDRAAFEIVRQNDEADRQASAIRQAGKPARPLYSNTTRTHV